VKGQPPSDFTVFYHLLSIERNSDVRLKVALAGESPSMPPSPTCGPTPTGYERETWDLFGIRFEGHPNLQRILLPRTWQGHPGARITRRARPSSTRFMLDAGKQDLEQDSLLFNPEEWGMKRSVPDHDSCSLNSRQPPECAWAPFRIILQLDGEEIVDCVPDIGYHHRGRRKEWRSARAGTPIFRYTDRIDYLGGVMNNLPYVLAVEKLAGIKVPQRVEVIRVMMTEFFPHHLATCCSSAPTCRTSAR